MPQSAPAKNAILNHGHDYLGQRLERSCSKVHGCICQVRVKASHLGINTGDHIWRTKGNVQKQHGKSTLSESPVKKTEASVRLQ